MPIEFHCEHCNKLIKAPDSEGGQVGKCPACKGRNYIPLPQDRSGEIPLVPLDESEERRMQRAAAEDAALQMKLLREKARDRDPSGKPAFRRPDASPAPKAPTSPGPAAAPAVSRKHLAGLIVTYIEAMSTGNLEKAEKIAAQLIEERRATAVILDEMMTEDLSAYGLPSLPRPVLVGFLKQLRGRM